ncbi:DUF2799 domain-containing protein [Shewanella corallii]|uniref:DUF2799 domain-containing protein n=1 Tax=Shewanella corallii TaxID=560080 RepID=A0ABT0N9K5_9GAMM|nr:DUF2799 domain-containing protein [Shewanella corallii]MCL2914512.1 DUF2799 domain-containing protein [Shewanella corallii]
MRFITLIAVLSMLTACSSLSVEDCANTDWQARGYDEAKRGFSLTQYDEYAKECKEIGGVIPLKSDYTTGHYKGTQEFCTATSGYAFGKSGGYYRAVCSEWNLDDSDFMKGYKPGSEYFAAKKKIDKAIKALEDHRISIEDASFQIRNRTERLNSPDLTEQQRRSIQIEIQNQKSRYNDLKRSEPRYVAKIDTAKAELEYLIQKHKQLNYCDYEGCFSGS